MTSAFLYAAVNSMEDAAVQGWAKANKLMLKLPMMKFVGGTMCYMVSVILTSWRDLEGQGRLFQPLALVVGIMSVAMVWGSAFLIVGSMRAPQKVAAKPL